MFNKIKSKEVMANWVNQSGKWSYFITLTFKDDLSELRAKYIFTGLCKKVNQKIFGKRSKRRLPMFPVFEFTKGGRVHFHFLLGKHPNISSFAIRKLILDTWNELPNTEIYHLIDEKKWFQQITPTTEKKLIKYCLKSAYKDLDCVLVEHIRF